MRKVYENIEMLREARGMTKRALASKVGIHEMSCSRYLWGASPIPAEMVRKFAIALGIEDINVFYDDELTDSVIAMTERQLLQV